MAAKSEQLQIGSRSFLLPLAVDPAENFVCLFTQNQVVEILAPRFVQPIPGSPRHLKGVVLYRDGLLPVIDLDELCNRHRPVRIKHYRQLAVIRTGAVDPKTGVPLKAVVAARERMQLARISGKEFAETFKQRDVPPGLSESGLVRGCFRREEDSVALLDLGPVVRGEYGPA
ncbi:MAG: chemotaxis protein CheW [Proteobacteria bacterium]|nr:chemotaxis protein CheW [Pseudomonadota bacterium]